MSVTWAGRNEWSLRLGHTPQPARGLRAIRRLVAAHRSATGLPARGSVELSEWRGVLDALRSLPMVAAGGSLGGLPETPAALTSERVRLATDAGASRARSVLSERRL